jgi:hypothetical protein
VTPADLPAERSHDPFCDRGVLAAIHALADFSHSKAMVDLVTAGKWAPELLITLGKVAPPRCAHFIGRRKDDPDPSVRRAVAVARGLMDNDAIAIPVLIQLLTRGDTEDDFLVRWAADESLIVLARRKGAEKTRRRLADLLLDRDRMTVVLAARRWRWSRVLRAWTAHPSRSLDRRRAPPSVRWPECEAGWRRRTS